MFMICSPDDREFAVTIDSEGDTLHTQNYATRCGSSEIFGVDDLQGRAIYLEAFAIKH